MGRPGLACAATLVFISMCCAMADEKSAIGGCGSESDLVKYVKADMVQQKRQHSVEMEQLRQQSDERYEQQRLDYEQLHTEMKAMRKTKGTMQENIMPLSRLIAPQGPQGGPPEPAKGRRAETPRLRESSREGDLSTALDENQLSAVLSAAGFKLPSAVVAFLSKMVKTEVRNNRKLTKEACVQQKVGGNYTRLSPQAKTAKKQITILNPNGACDDSKGKCCLRGTPWVKSDPLGSMAGKYSKNYKPWTGDHAPISQNCAMVGFGNDKTHLTDGVSICRINFGVAALERLHRIVHVLMVSLMACIIIVLL